jgi:hypothetical protein
MPRKKTAPAAAEPPPATGEAPPPESASLTKPPTKGRAMDAALAAGAVMPADAVAYVKAHFGIDVSAKQFSAHKSLARQKAAVDARNKAAKPAAAVAKAPAAVARFGPPASKPASPADLARQLKALVAAHGADAVGEMLDVFRE